MEIPLNDSSYVVYAIGYLLTFRLAVILLGAMSIYLGYRLFIQALGDIPSQNNGNAGEMTAKTSHFELSLKNAAPGTFFAAFGALITITVLASSPPEFTLQAAPEPLVSASANVSTMTSTASVTLRSDQTDSAEALHQAIWTHYDQALALSKQLVKAEPSNGQYWDTLAALQFMDGEFAQALVHQREAVKLLPNDAILVMRLRAYEVAQ